MAFCATFHGFDPLTRRACVMYYVDILYPRYMRNSSIDQRKFKKKCTGIKTQIQTEFKINKLLANYHDKCNIF